MSGLHEGPGEPPEECGLRIDRFLPWFLLHFLLGAVLWKSPALATLHALATLAIGIIFALDTQRPWRVAAVGAYLAGCDVLWRMAHADVWHQFGKYAASGIFLFWIFRTASLKRALAPALFLLCLVPSIWIAFEGREFDFVLGRISFNLSGPVALGIAFLFFRQLELTRRQLTILLAWAASAVFAVYAVALLSTVTASEIQFTTESNFTTSGGFGPNQVSATLGLGTVCLFWLLILTEARGLARPFVWAGLVALGTQSVLTFSRGGVYTAVAAVVVALPSLAGYARTARHVVGAGIALLFASQLVLLPMLDSFTHGKVEERYEQTGLTGRREIMQRDLELWQENPLFGVGAGMSAQVLVARGQGRLAHTEFTRLLAEHGLFGLLALTILAGMSVGAVVRARAGPQRAFALSCATWALLFMSHAAMRLEAPAIMLGLAGVAFSTRWKMAESTAEEFDAPVSWST